MMPREKKAEELGEFGIFTNIDRVNVVQETRAFSDTPLSPKRCVTILSKVLYLLGQGEQFNEKDATTVFFASTKSFQCKDVPVIVLICVAVSSSPHLSDHQGTLQQVARHYHCHQQSHSRHEQLQVGFGLQGQRYQSIGYHCGWFHGAKY